MTNVAFDPRRSREISDTRGLARRINEMERRLKRLETQVGPPGRRVFWGEVIGPWSTANPPTVGLTFNIVVPGVYLVAAQWTAFTTTAGLISKELFTDGTLLNSTGQYINTINEHTTVALEGGFVEWDVGSHTVTWRVTGTGATSDIQDRGSAWAWRTS